MQTMRKLLLLGLIGLVGCQSIVASPTRKTGRNDNDPMLIPAEQQRRVRASFAFPDNDLGPSSGPYRPLFEVRQGQGP
jgi:hypothetical protein